MQLLHEFCRNASENPAGIETWMLSCAACLLSNVATHQKTQQGLKHRAADEDPIVRESQRIRKPSRD